MACFGNAYPKITVTAKARFQEQEPLVRDGDYTLKWIAAAKCAQWHS
jgi:hypothetical protein